MLISQKSIYALRAVFELSFRGSSEPVKLSRIAEAQNIPPKFLEIILNELKHAGYVLSRRGKEGGFTLSCTPGELTVGQIIRAVQGPVSDLGVRTGTAKSYHQRGKYAFGQMWGQVSKCLQNVLDNTSIQDLVELEKSETSRYVVNYAI